MCVRGGDSVDTVDFGIQVLVFRVVRRLSEAVSCHPVTLAHSSLALVIGHCTDTGSHSLAPEADRKSSTEATDHLFVVSDQSLTHHLT